jgi:hypothetical protein
MQTLQELMLAVRKDPALVGCFARVSSTDDGITLIAPLPSDRRIQRQPLPRRLSEMDVSVVQIHLQRSGFPRVVRGAVNDAIGLLADDRTSWGQFLRRQAIRLPSPWDAKPAMLKRAA